MKMITGLLALVAGAIVFNTAFAVPRYSAPVAQVGDSPAIESTEATTQNPSAPVLQRIKQEAQSCKTVVVKLMQRPLDMDFFKDSVGGVARTATGGTAAHVQVVAVDKSTGRVIDNFGVTGDFGGGGKARIFNEKNLNRYDSEPCGAYEMSSDDYYAAKERTIKQIEGGAIYEPYSGVGLKDMAIEGAGAGAQAVAPLGSIASAVGAAAGAVGGAMAANDIYETRRHDYGIHSDGNVKMSFPIVNCQAGGDMFVKNLAGLSTAVTVKEYIQPGEKVAQPDECRDEAKCIDTAKLEELLKEGILFLKDLIAKGKRATNSQIDTHNKRVNRMVDELVDITKQINSFNVSAEEKKRISEEALADVVLLNSQFNSLCEQAKSMGLVNEATNGQKMELIKNVQGELSEISRDAQRAKDSSAKATVAPQRRTMTDEEAIRLLREDGSGIKAVADALKD